MGTIIKFNLNGILKKYSKNSQEAYFDPIRGKLLKANPEEEVRIKFIAYLKNILGVPEDMLRTELPLAKIQKGLQGRIDILGNYYDESLKQNNSLFIVECKSANIALTENAFNQALKYSNNITTVRIIIITNGLQTIFYIKEGKEFVRINNILTYSEMLDMNKIRFEYNINPHLVYHRKQHSNLSMLEEDDRAFERCWIGEGSPKDHYSYLFNIIGLFNDYHSSLIFPIQTKMFSLIKDGYRYTSFGNAGGGAWPGDYRYFMIEDDKKQNQIISFGIIGKAYKDENPLFPNSNGHTMFIVAIDDFDKSHNSLQLDLDKFVKIDGRNIIVWHDGTITAGASGRLKNSEVIDYVSLKAPELIINNRIQLGTLPYNELITWRYAEKFLVNCITYAMLRDEIRAMHK